MAAEARKTSEALPRRIGRYEAFLQIGAGGMARVYLAVQRGPAGTKPELVVVKILRPEARDDEQVVALFTDEARIATRLDHPNVIRTREVVAEPPDYLLAMDFHNGRSLLDVLDRIGRAAVPLDEHIYILCRVLAGLGYAHELRDEQGKPFGIVHRDVSPANVLVSYGGEVKLLDFGIAKATGALVATRDGVVRGKLGYAAPEQCLGHPADPRSDVYAVGVMLWEAIAGRRRVTGETWQSVLQARLEDTEPAIEEVCPDADPELVAIVHRAVARAPDARYPTAREFQAELETHLAGRGKRLGPARIAAMLKPHFEQDRAELHSAVESALRGGKAGQPGRPPLPGARAAAPAVPSAPAVPGASAREENTAPIPVDAALLTLSREEASPPPASAVPTAPPPAPEAPADPPESGAITVPPPDSGATTVPPPEPSGTAAAPPPGVEASPPPASAPARPSPEALDAFGLVQVAQVASAPAWAAAALDAPAPKKKAPVLALLLLAAGALGLGAVVLVPQLGSKKNAAAPAVQVAEQKPSTVSAAAPKEDTVKVRIAVDPPDAVVTLDGRVIEGNPYVAVVPRDKTPHELLAVAEGCTDQKQEVRFSGDISLLVALKCQRIGMRLSAKPGARKVGAPGGAAQPKPTALPAGLTASPEPPPAPPVANDNPY